MKDKIVLCFRIFILLGVIGFVSGFVSCESDDMPVGDCSAADVRTR